MKYVPLYIKTHNSLLESMIKVEDLIKRAKELNFKSLTITDNSMHGVMDFYNSCLKNNIKPIIGLEINVMGKKVVLYAMNELGYNNLNIISTIASEHDLEIQDLKKYNVGLLAIIPFSSIDLYDELVSIYHNIYKGYQSLMERDSLEGNNLVYMQETIYLDINDADYINYLYAIKYGTTIDNMNVGKSDNYLKTLDEIEKRYPYDLDNNYKINELCNIKIEHHKDLLPIYPCPNNMDSYSYLKELCKEGLRRLFGDRVSKVYAERLKYELDIINKMGFCNYFLIVWDYVKFAKENNILVGPGRGSAAGSLVSYCLNITSIDPVKYDLLFERFLNPERITMPDIDIDFEDTKRDLVIEYCINKYGLKKVAGIITFGTLATKQVIRDLGRVCKIDSKVIDHLAHMIDSNLSLLENYEQNQKLKDYIAIDNELKKLYKIALKFEGLNRHTSIHASGIVMANNELTNYVPLVLNGQNFYITAYSMEYLEALGLLKMDFLGLRNLSLISDVINEINKDKNINLTFDNIPENDSKALKIFEDVNTLGIFQFESDGMMSFLRKFRPNNYEEISAAVALFRPGPKDNIDTYIKRKRGKDSIEYYHQDLKPILEPTYGVIIYQEQIMQIASKMAGYTLGEADVLRRAMGKKDESILRGEKDKFINGSIKRGYDQKISEQVFNLIYKFANYGFNRAHSFVYAMVAYKMAYLKANYSAYFMKSLLSMVIGSESKTKEYIYECKLNNISILKPDINLSYDVYTIEEFGIRYPLTSIKNVGLGAAKGILEERSKGKYKDIFDFVKRTYGRSVNRKTIESLINAGCFVSFGLNKKTLNHNLDLIINYAETFGDLDDDLMLKPELTIVSDYTKQELMQMELEVFGFYLSNHPTSEYKLRYNSSISLIKLSDYFDKVVDIVVYIDRVKEVTTKKKDKMLFVTGSDEATTIDIVLFPDTYKKYNKIETGDIVLVNGKVEKRFDKLQLVVNEITKIG